MAMAPKGSPKEEDEEELQVRMTLGEHLDELRSRLLKSLVVLLVALVVAMFFYEGLVEIITRPHSWAMDRLGVSPEESRLLPGSYGAPIVAVLKLALIASLFVSFPWIGYQMWAFISAGLYRRERAYVRLFAPISFALFTAGCLFGFFVLVPYCLYGLAKTMRGTTILSNQYLFSDYLTLVMTLTIVLGAVFQMPLLMVFFAKIGLVPPAAYHRWRRAAIVGNTVFAALVTPADVLSMILVAVPMLLLYEIGVVASIFLARPAKRV